MKLRFQLAFLVVFVIVASLAAVMLLTLYYTKDKAERDAKDAALEAADDIAHDLSLLLPLTDEGIERRLEAALRQHRRLAEIELEMRSPTTSPETKPLRESKNEGPEKKFPYIRRLQPRSATPASPPLAQKHLLSVTTGDTSKRGVEYAKDIDGRFIKGRLTVTLSLGVVDKILETQTEVTYGVASVAVLLATLLVVFTADRIIGRPLARLAAAMGQISEHALDRRVDVAGPAEIKTVSKAFNTMLDRLQEADKAVRSFNERLGAEVTAATAALSEQNTALGHLNTLLVRTREDLAHKERLAALGQLAAQLAHEIGTPLGSVSGHLQLAMASAECPASLRDRLVIATQEIARVSRIIRDYLDSTRRIDPTVTTVSVDRTIHEAVEVARGGNNARSAEVHIEVAPDAAAWRTDEGVARQIIVNLVANALDAVSTSRDADHAGVTVRASAEDSKTPGRRDLVVRISDTGPGLSQEAVGRLFEPFYTTKGRGKGTGLGLAICRELAQSLGGKIEGASEPGHGTTFTVRIPNGDEVARRAQVVAVTKPVVAQLVERTPG